MEQNTVRQIEQIIGYTFSDPTLLERAFTHSSAVDNRTLSNERLEFLGDSVLALVICSTLFDRSPNYLEGDLTKMKSMLVSRRTCARVARGLHLHKLLVTGKGMASSPSVSGSLAAGLLEAIIAAIYVDGGFDKATKFILETFGPLIQQADAEQTHGNFKSVLQQYAQQELNTTPVYELLDEKGPDHNKCFEIQAVVDKRHFPSAWGTNKKHAEQKAALNALIELDLINPTSAESVAD